MGLVVEEETPTRWQVMKANIRLSNIKNEIAAGRKSFSPGVSNTSTASVTMQNRLNGSQLKTK